MISYDWITTYHGFMALQPDWQRLQSNQQHSHAWYQACWCWQPNNSRPKILVIYQSKKVVAICPLLLTTRYHFGLKCNRIENWVVPDTQFYTFLYEPRLAKTLYSLISKALTDIPFHWDYCCYQRINPVTRALFLQDTSIAIKLYTQVKTSMPIIELRQGWDTYYKSLPRKFKKNINHINNKIKAQTGITHEQHVIDEQNWTHHLSNMIAISTKSWKAKTENGLNQPSPRAFITTLLKTLSAKKCLTIWYLKHQTFPIAYELILREQASKVALRADYDESYQSLSPGSYLNYIIIRTLFKTDLHKYNFGHGNNAYKLRWASGKETLCNVISYNQTISGRILQLIQEYLRPIYHQIGIRLKRLNKKP